jgi:hypothetical protein
MRGLREETRLGRNVWGGCCLFVPGGELKGNKKIETTICRGLRWLPTYTATNQKHTHATKDVYKNQIKVNVNRGGCTGAERVGGCCRIVPGDISNDKKNQKLNHVMAIVGCRWIIRHTNQPKVCGRNKQRR